MAKERKPQTLPSKSLKSINRQLTPIDSNFNVQILKLKMNDIVDIALNHKPPSLYKQYREKEEMTIDILKLMLIGFQDFYNCKSKMNDAQLTETSYLICQHFRHLNYYDIGMCLKRAKMREKVYDRIDGGMIMDWLTIYEAERTNMIITERQNQKAKYDSEWSALGDRTSEKTLKNFLKD